MSNDYSHNLTKGSFLLLVDEGTRVVFFCSFVISK